MRTSVAVLGGAALLTFGYVLGSAQIFAPATLLAQGDQSKPTSGVEITDETKTKIKAASDALKAAMDALVDEGKYVSAIKGINTFAVLSGGINSIRDLENNAVVDPETFSALYANLATDTIAAELGRDADGKLTYKNKVIRIYPVSAIRAKYAIRGDITGEELLPSAGGSDDAAKKKAAAKGE